MDIYTFKKQFEQQVKPSPSQLPVAAERAWKFFEESMREELTEELCEEFGFSASLASTYDGKVSHIDENLFQVYFGRLIDARKGAVWHTAEINFYYRYSMNEQLRSLLTDSQDQEIETAFCLTEEPESIARKIEKVFTFADKKNGLWDAIRHIEPASASFIFWIQ